MVIKSLSYILGAVLLCYLISTWFYTNLRGNFKFSEKTKTSSNYSFHHGQSVANKPNLSDFDNPTLKNLLTNFDGSDHNYSSICVFP